MPTIAFILVAVAFGVPSNSLSGSDRTGNSTSTSEREQGEATEVDSQVPTPASARRGYELLTTKAYLPADFSSEDVRQIWRAWPDALRERAEQADDEFLWRMIFERYGFTERVAYESGLPDGSGKPLQYVVDDGGNWSMNCFACHGGTVVGQPYPGSPNNRFAFQLFAQEMRESKLRRGKLLNKFDMGSLLMPLGTSRGTTNAVMFGVGLMHFRNQDLEVEQGKLPPQFTHHDMDAPPWWHFKKRPNWYIDGFAEKGHRGLMQFLMVKENSGQQLKQWSDEFRHVAAYLESISAPRYPFEIDAELSRRGQTIFNEHCASCHGTYIPGAVRYPNLRVPLAEIGTDPVRLEALKPVDRAKYARSWFTNYGQENTLTNPDGYVAPPLDGVWASAPYFHNGSVPTLWGVLNSHARPTKWQHVMDLDGQADANFDPQEVGLKYKALQKQDSVSEPLEVFDTSAFGKSNQGHTYPDALTPDEKWALLEYLKTL